MAKKSLIARQEKRKNLVRHYAAKRAELKAKGDYTALDKLPKNASPVRLRRLCRLTGRARRNIRKFEMCGHMVRELASQGLIPGMKKSSA